jgi:nickel transport protein
LSDGNLRISYESSFTAQKISVFEPSALLGLGVVGLLALRKKRI